VMFAPVNKSVYDGTPRIILSSMTFKPTTEPDFSTAVIDSQVEIPENVTVGTEIPYSASVKLADGSTRYINGYKADRTVDSDNNFGVSLISGSGIEINDGYIKSTCAGPIKFAVSAKINGAKLESKEYEFISTITEPQEMVLDFTQNVIISPDSTTIYHAPSAWEFATNAGYEILLDKTATNNGQFNHPAIGDTSFVKMQTKGEDWPEKATREPMVTFKKYIGAAGYYKVTFEGVKWYANSQYAIYVDGKYAGDYNFYDSSATKPTKRVAETFNTVYLDEGYAEISFRLRKRFYDSANLIPWSLTLTPADKPLVSTLECELPTEMNKGESADITARALMSDGTYRSFGYTDVGEVPTEDIINVKSSNTDVVSVENLVQINEDPTTTKFALSAKNPGTADITVTALVDNVPTEKKVKITVPYTDESESVKANVSYIVRGSEREFDAGINMIGYEAGNIDSHAFNTSFTAVAEEKLVVGEKLYNFAYWQTTGGVPVEGAGAEYTFAPKSNFTLEAVYVPAEPTDADKKVQFYNFNRVLLGEEAVENGKVSKMPTQPVLAGHTFAGWVAENIGAFSADTELTAALTRVVAQFTTNEGAYSVKVNGEQEGVYTYGELFEKTAAETRDSQVFSHWKIGDQVVSYDRTIGFYVWNNVELTAVYEDETLVAVPTVVLDNIGDEYFICYEVPNGYTAIDAGIVFGSRNPRVDSTDGSKASVREVKSKGQFTAVPHPDAASDAACGYIMYKVDATGDIRVIYTK
ncbi:MAG: hypothetical protein IJF32_05985, partial [Oscillospiraceae bacterium]|nr:hypothetical protein [Oscillospiraceae bacterium]